MQTETDPRIKALWELHLGMEIEHLRIACEQMKAIEKIDPAEFLPANGMPQPMMFEPNKEYVRDVLRRTVDWSSWDAKFLSIDDLPPEHRFFDYQRASNAGGVPTEQVIDDHRAQFGSEYRRETEGPHPVEALQEGSNHEAFSYWHATKAANRVGGQG